jgi:hypothetical protein
LAVPVRLRFVVANDESIEVELRGDDFADMGDAEIVLRAEASMSKRRWHRTRYPK